mgnify:CR=1 FL=1
MSWYVIFFIWAATWRNLHSFPTRRFSYLWKTENDWFVNDFEKSDEARRYSEFLDVHQPELKGREYLDAISDHIRQKFQNPNRQRATAVDGGTPKASSKSGNLFNKLDAEGKATFNMYVRDGVFKNTAEDREEYAKDVLA